jgi:hypothetical protein
MSKFGNQNKISKYRYSSVLYYTRISRHVSANCCLRNFLHTYCELLARHIRTIFVLTSLCFQKITVFILWHVMLCTRVSLLELYVHFVHVMCSVAYIVCRWYWMHGWRCPLSWFLMAHYIVLTIHCFHCQCVPQSSNIVQEFLNCGVDL